MLALLTMSKIIIPFSGPVEEAVILKRYKRFLADVELPSGKSFTVHTANTGSMKTCWAPGWKALISDSQNPKRKLRHSLELTHNGETWIGVNTATPNKLVYEALKAGFFPEIPQWENIKPEYSIGDSRLDFWLSNGDQQAFIEVKNVTLLGPDRIALFPDAISDRGSKHLIELAELAKSGHKAFMIFIIQREDVDKFSPAAEIDALYALYLKEAEDAGVKILPYRCKVSPKGVELECKLDLVWELP